MTIKSQVSGKPDHYALEVDGKHIFVRVYGKMFPKGYSNTEFLPWPCSAKGAAALIRHGEKQAKYWGVPFKQNVDVRGLA